MSVPHPAPGRTAAPRSAPGSNRLIASWAMVSTGAVVLVAIIVFALQNTGGVGFSFLWMHGTLPLSMALLVAGFGGAVLALLVGTTRVADVRDEMVFRTPARTSPRCARDLGAGTGPRWSPTCRRGPR